MVALKDIRTKCSIILIVYTRSEFVEQALNSLESQSVEKDVFEVLIISNVELKLLRVYNLNLRIILSDQKSLAGKLAQGIVIARNEVITFLEDDDVYCKDRVNNILAVFRDNKDVDYYHNMSKHFRTLTSLQKVLEICSGESAHFTLSNRNSESIDITDFIEYKLNKYQADYNLSSMAVRKTFIIGYIDIFYELGIRYIDTFIFSLALYKSNSIFIDSRISTLIRTHSMNASQTVDTIKGLNHNSRYSKDMNDLIVAFNKVSISGKKFVKHFVLARGLDDLMKSNSIPRHEVITVLIKLLKIYGRYFLKSDVTRKGLLYIVSPNLMHKLLVKFHDW